MAGCRQTQQRVDSSADLQTRKAGAARSTTVPAAMSADAKYDLPRASGCDTTRTGRGILRFTARHGHCPFVNCPLGWWLGLCPLLRSWWSGSRCQVTVEK